MFQSDVIDHQYIAVQDNRVFDHNNIHKTLFKKLNSQKTSHNSPLRASYGMPLGSTLGE